MDKQWYVVNTYSGHENKVKEKLEMRSESMDMQDYIFRVIVPEQTIVEEKDGVTKEKVKKMFPGYILVEMVMSDEAWYVVRNTPGVTGFIGSSGKGAKPTTLQPYEVDNILNNMGMSHDEYLDLKKELSERLVGVQKPDPDERAEALAETFNVTKLEAMNVLTECNNDLRAAVKVLHTKTLENSD